MPSASAPMAARVPAPAFMPHNKDKAEESIGLYQRIKNVVYTAFSPLIASYNFIHAKNPVTQKREFWFLPTSFEKLLGDWIYSVQVNRQGGQCTKAKYVEKVNMVNEVGNTLAKQTKRKSLNEYEFTVINTKSLNAWALPQKIAINRGLIEEMEGCKIEGDYKDITLEDKVAAVLAHEITHSDARHSARSLEKVFILNIFVVITKVYLATLEIFKSQNKKCNSDDLNPLMIITNFLSDIVMKVYMLANSRSHEYEADKYGMYMMEQAGYNPKAAVWLQEFFKQQFKSPKTWIGKVQEFFSTHPMTANRLEENKKTLQAIETIRADKLAAAAAGA